METKVYVGNLDFSVGEEELRELMSEVGEVVDITLIKDHDTGRSRGFAFVELSAQTEAEEAVKKFHGYFYEGRELKVNLARPREKRSGRYRSSRHSGY